MGKIRAKKAVSLERLKELLDFDPETGTFRWKDRIANRAAGSMAGGLKNGSLYIRIDEMDYTSARLAWFWTYGEWPNLVTFLNKDRSDIRPCNLREKFVLPSKYDHKSKEGRAAYQLEYRSQKREVFREDAMRRKFGIGFAEYKEKLKAQNGVCAICEQPERATRSGRIRWLAIDHNHKTGAIRDLLCNNCNVMIGFACDDPTPLIRAIAYLQRHSHEEAEMPANVVQLKGASS